LETAVFLLPLDGGGKGGGDNSPGFQDVPFGFLSGRKWRKWEEMGSNPFRVDPQNPLIRRYGE
jgi:hypothetical protein